MEWPSGVFIRADAIQQYGDGQVRVWLRTGAWRRVARGIYASMDTALTPVQSIDIASRSAGRDLVVVGRSAALIHGFGLLTQEVVHLAGKSTRTARAWDGLQIHGLKIPPDDVVRVGEMTVTTTHRTVVDLARDEDRLDGLAVADAAIRLGVCTTDSLKTQLASQRGSRGIVRARQTIGWADGAAESPMESRARLRILDSHLPRPAIQWWVVDSAGQRKYRLDLAWPEYRVGLEYDGADHLDRLRQRRDLERRAWLASAGWRVLWVTDVDIYREYRKMLRRLEHFMALSSDHAETALSIGVSRAVSA